MKNVVRLETVDRYDEYCGGNTTQSTVWLKRGGGVEATMKV